ncbi:MAG: YbgC/FadM family acyl-CoA thioesterase [Blastomonas sp.]
MPDHAILRPLTGHFKGDRHLFACRVYYEDTDLSGIVYHANYLRFCERARSDMLRCVGIDQRDAHEAGHGVYAVSEMQIKFVHPARLEDDLMVESRVMQIRAAAVFIHQRVMRTNADDSLHELFRADVLAAFINPEGRPIRQPEQWVHAFRSVLSPHAIPDNQKKAE